MPYIWLVPTWSYDSGLAPTKQPNVSNPSLPALLLTRAPHLTPPRSSRATAGAASAAPHNLAGFDTKQRAQVSTNAAKLMPWPQISATSSSWASSYSFPPMPNHNMLRPTDPTPPSPTPPPRFDNAASRPSCASPRPPPPPPPMPPRPFRGRAWASPTSRTPAQTAPPRPPPRWPSSSSSPRSSPPPRASPSTAARPARPAPARSSPSTPCGATASRPARPWPGSPSPGPA
mmetsp:Transcript_30028/g.62952  ORF Transcript_30028/g.62952 Transcript_30028/m.62952 type:complete len:231 (+) Transcript_30028:358-1050(+)